MRIDNENLEKIKLAQKITKKQISLVLAGTVLVTTPIVILTNKKKNKNQTLYLMEIKNEDSFAIYNKYKEKEQIKIDVTEDMYVITDQKKEFNLYESYIVNNKGEMQKCYLTGEYIDFSETLDEINLPKDIAYKSELDIVTPKDGAWLRKNKKIDKNTDNAKLLTTGTYVIASAISSTTKDNDYFWKETISVDIDNRSFYSGYMVDGYLMDSNFEKAQGIKFKTDLAKDGYLNIRELPSINGNILNQLHENEEVVLIPNLPSTQADNIDWFYIAYKNESDKTCFGYCAATEYKHEGKEIKYLKESDTSFLTDEKYKKKRIDFSKYDNEKMIEKIVNINGEAEHLNMRERPGTDSNIIHYLDEGTYLYTYKSDLEKTVSKDGFNWIKVYLVDGTEGYVADNYLKDYNENIANEVNRKYENQSENTNTYNFNNVQVNGYFGIDINNTADPSVFEKTITNDNYYEDDYPLMSQNRKIDFAVIKLGATANGRGPFQVIKNDAILSNINALTNVCEKNGIPYGMYYYSQATTKEEADCEVKEIISMLEKLGIKSKNYMKLPLYIDIECYGYEYGESYNARVLTNAIEKGKSFQTEILNYTMNGLREKTGMEVCLYTDYNTLNTTIDFKEIIEINKKNCWIVETTKTHSDNLKSYDSSLYEYMKMRQTEIDTNIYIEETGDSIMTDFDIIDEEYFNRHIR
jgi:hypothetical protein